MFYDKTIITYLLDIHLIEHSFPSHTASNGPLARYVKLRVRMRRECRERFPHHRRWAIPTCITARASRTCRDRQLSVSFEIGGGGKRSRHSRRMRNLQFYVSGKRPMAWCPVPSHYQTQNRPNSITNTTCSHQARNEFRWKANAFFNWSSVNLKNENSWSVIICCTSNVLVTVHPDAVMNRLTKHIFK